MILFCFHFRLLTEALFIFSGIPDSYDGTRPYALFIANPGREGKSETEIRRLLILDIRNGDFEKDYEVDHTYGVGETLCLIKKTMNRLSGSVS